MSSSHNGEKDRDRQEAFLELFLAHQDDIRAVLGGLVRDRNACEDVFQDVSLTLWRTFDRYDPRRPFGAWARGIAVRKAFQYFDRVRRQGPTLAPEAAEAVLEVFNEIRDESVERRQALRICIEKLPGRSRRLLRLRYDEELKLKEVAARMSRKLDAVHKALSRIRDALRRCVEREMKAAAV